MDGALTTKVHTLICTVHVQYLPIKAFTGRGWDMGLE